MKQLTIIVLLVGLFSSVAFQADAQIGKKLKEKVKGESKLESEMESIDDAESEELIDKEAVVSDVNKEAKIVVEEVMTSFGVDMTPGLKVNIVGASKKALQKSWSKHLKKATDVRKVEEDRTGEMVADMALIPGLESLPMSIFSMVKESSTGAEVHTSFKLDEIFLSSDNEDKWAIVRDFIYEFAVDYRKGLVEEELQQAQKSLKSEQTNFKKLKDKNASLYKDIEGYKEKIAQAEEDIIQNEKDQKGSTLAIDKLMKAAAEVERRLNSIE